MRTNIPQKVDIVFDNTESIATSDIIAFEMADIESRNIKDSIGQEMTLLTTDYAKITFKLSTFDTSLAFDTNMPTKKIIERLAGGDVSTFDIYEHGSNTPKCVALPWDAEDLYINMYETIEIDEANQTMTLTFKEA